MQQSKQFSTRFKACLLIASLSLGAILPYGAVFSDSEMESVRSAIEALQQDQRAMRQELEEIKDMLRRPSGRGQASAFQPFDLSVSGAPHRGEPTAPVTMVEFTDYQCPFCARYASDTLPKILAEYVEPGKVRYVIRELPITERHSLAGQAAEAALCAGTQGKYWEMHDTLFRNQSRFEHDDLQSYARSLGLDLESFSKCLETGEFVATLRKDRAAAISGGVRGTPAFFFGLTDPDEVHQIRVTRSISGAEPFAVFQGILEQLLAQAENAGQDAGAEGVSTAQDRGGNRTAR